MRHDIVGYTDGSWSSNSQTEALANKLAFFEQYQEYVARPTDHAKSNPYRCLPFLDKNHFNSLLNTFLAHQLPDESPAIPLINSILALGCRLVIQLKSQDGTLADHEGRRYHVAALAARVNLISMQPTIISIQVGHQHSKMED